MEQCGRWPALRLKDGGGTYLSLDRCRDRCCPKCSRIRSHQIADRISEAVKPLDTLRHLVLTTQTTEGGLAEQIDHLVGSFRRLRQTKGWRRYMKGGIATLQVTRNPNTGGWHPHLHVLVTGSYMPQDLIADLWEISSRGSRICHISAVHNRSQGATYIAKYVACPPDMAKWPPPAVVEFARAMRARRILIAFGSLSRTPMQPKDRDPDEGPSKHLISLPILDTAEKRGIPEARTVIRWLRQTNPRAYRLVTPLPDDVPRMTDTELADVEGRIGELCAEIYRRLQGPPPRVPPPKPPPPPYIPGIFSPKDDDDG